LHPLLDNERTVVWSLVTPMDSAPAAHRHVRDAVVVSFDSQTPQVAFVASGTVHGNEGGDLELQLRRKLHLPWIEYVARTAESELRRRRGVGIIDAAPDGVDVLDVHSVEQVEDVQ
jgi:hypothetical protein